MRESERDNIQSSRDDRGRDSRKKRKNTEGEEERK